jgi:hypothetical protein
VIDSVESIGEIDLEHEDVFGMTVRIFQGGDKELCLDVCVMTGPEPGLSSRENIVLLHYFRHGFGNELGPEFEQSITQPYWSVVIEVSGVSLFEEEYGVAAGQDRWRSRP